MIVSIVRYGLLRLGTFLIFGQILDGNDNLLISCLLTFCQRLADHYVFMLIK